MIRINIRLVFWTWLIPAVLFGQEQASSNVHVAESYLKVLNDSLYKGSTDSVKLKYNLLFTEKFKQFLAFPGNEKNPFDSLKALSQVQSNDGKLKIYTWMLQLDSFSVYKNFGIIVYSPPKGKSKLIYELKETDDTTSKPLQLVFSASGWYSALYYRLVEVKKGKSSYYVLLGWKGHNSSTSMKVIEALYFEGDKPFFGKRVFDFENKLQSRVIFEFSSQAVMMLKYDDIKRMIVFDHLGPADGWLDNDYSKYGPDFSVDALKFENDYWNYIKDVDLRSDQSQEPTEVKRKKQLYTPQE